MIAKLTRQKIKKRLGEALFDHCAGVEEAAVAMARSWAVNEEKAAAAALLHDWGKTFACAELIEYARQKGLLLDELTVISPALLHAPVGALMVKEEFKIKDPEILEAIACHTTGKPGMGVLARIIYLADVLEPGRRYPGVEQIREAASRDLDSGVLAAVEHTIGFVLERGLLLHPDSVRLRNALLLDSRRQI